MIGSPIERFWAKVKKSNGCWNWTGSNDGRYGQIHVDDHLVKTHRFAYEILVGPILPGFKVLHHCDNEKCVRPSHLFLGTQHDNNIDALRKGRKDCKLSEDEVKEIRRLAGKEDVASLSERFGVSKSTIFRTQSRKKWRHL